MYLFTKILGIIAYMVQMKKLRVRNVKLYRDDRANKSHP